jgi:hypothetical protein
MPEKLVHDVITRLLEIGELESGSDKPRQRRRLASQPPAAIPQQPAEKPALQEGNGREGITSSSEEGKTHDLVSTGVQEGGPVNGKTQNPLPLNLDDDEKPKTYTDPTEELKAIYQAQAGEPITIAVLVGIQETIELKGVSMADFVSKIRKHTGNKWRNPAGFLRDKANKFKAETTPAAPSAKRLDVVVPRENKCELCGCQRGAGLVLKDRKPVACACATPEYVARMVASGVLVAGGVQ